jgi:hypothetical protein
MSMSLQSQLPVHASFGGKWQKGRMRPMGNWEVVLADFIIFFLIKQRPLDD